MKLSEIRLTRWPFLVLQANPTSSRVPMTRRGEWGRAWRSAVMPWGLQSPTATSGKELKFDPIPSQKGEVLTGPET